MLSRHWSLMLLALLFLSGHRSYGYFCANLRDRLNVWPMLGNVLFRILG